jgi:Protein of unknown function (DUF1538)
VGEQAAVLARETLRNLRDLLPIVVVILLFQALVIGTPMPDTGRRTAGAIAALLGLTFFGHGLSMSIFPLGAELAERLARRGSVAILLAFGFAIGFASTVAEPALVAVTAQAAAAVAPGAEDVARIALTLRLVVAVALGAALALGILRIVLGWPAVWFVVPGYVLASILALTSDSPLALLAFDAGAAATSAINIPLMLALGSGLALVIRGRSPIVDGFGLVALASLTPMLVILAFSLVAG